MCVLAVGPVFTFTVCTPVPQGCPRSRAGNPCLLSSPRGKDHRRVWIRTISRRSQETPEQVSLCHSMQIQVPSGAHQPLALFPLLLKSSSSPLQRVVRLYKTSIHRKGKCVALRCFSRLGCPAPVSLASCHGTTATPGEHQPGQRMRCESEVKGNPRPSPAVVRARGPPCTTAGQHAPS